MLSFTVRLLKTKIGLYSGRFNYYIDKSCKIKSNEFAKKKNWSLDRMILFILLSKNLKNIHLKCLKINKKTTNFFEFKNQNQAMPFCIGYDKHLRF